MSQAKATDHCYVRTPGADASCGPPLGDASRWTPHIVAVMVEPEVQTPRKAIVNVRRSTSCSLPDWEVINTVRKNVNAIMLSGAEQSIAQALLTVRDVASPAVVGSEVALALRPLERSLAVAFVKVAHNTARDRHWVNKDGPRAEFLRDCELEFGKQLTPRLRSRMLLTYHKVYGPKEKADAALFSSRSCKVKERKGYARPARRKKTAPPGDCTSSNVKIDSQATEKENEPRATPHAVVLPAAASKRSRKTKKKAGAPVSSNVEDEEQDTALPMTDVDAYAALVQMPRTGTNDYTTEQYDNYGYSCHARCEWTGMEYYVVAQPGPYPQQHAWWKI
jgi:hypothetical protein